MTDTAKSWTLAKAPKKLSLRGDKRSPESSQHIIEFPGGSIEVCRVDNEYWVHIAVNREGFDNNNGEGFHTARGEIVDSRIDYTASSKLDIADFPNAAAVQHVALRIRPCLK